ncbi:hypothetical protein BGZ73_004539 [Actinomortierella ambigua]|nr:hypothetical protein BGZ73_004539 [Actinomortierella ambigua]
MRIAVEGCCHGELDEIYKAIALRESRGGFKVDLLLICGDFQAVRNEADLEAMAIPRKFLQLGTFHKYYSGEQIAPIPTVFIGGNHEASNYLWELFHGGWVCPNIYFLGWGGVINVGGLRIGGMSGIYKSGHYNTGHYEILPYNDNHKRSIYHIRKFDIFKMVQVKEPLDIFLSHDWPRGIEQYGDVDGLIRRKPFFRDEIQKNELGSIAFEQVLNALKPAHWFSAHLHVKFTAHVPWTKDRFQRQPELQPQPLSEPSNNPDEIKIDFDEDDISTPASSHTPANPDEIQISLDDEDDDTTAPPTDSSTPAPTASNPDEISINDDDISDSTEDMGQTGSSSTASAQPTTGVPAPTASELTPAEPASQPVRQYPSETKFLALDKCLPKRQFLEIIDIPEVQGTTEFRYDQEWLAIVRTLDKYMSLDHHQPPAPEGKRLARELEENRRWVNENITGDKLLIPSNFVQTTPPHNPIHTLGPKEKHDYNLPYLNPQTEAFCELLQIPNQINSGGIQAGSSSHAEFDPPVRAPPPTSMNADYQQGPGGFYRPPRPPNSRRPMNQPMRGAASHSPYPNPPRRPPPSTHYPPSPNAHSWRPRPPMNRLPFQPTEGGGPPRPYRQPMNLPPPTVAGGGGGEMYQPPRRPMNLPPPTASGGQGAEGASSQPQMPRLPMNLPPPVNQP